MTSKNTIICCACGKEQETKKAFRMYEFVCCSNKCIEPLRKQRQNEEKLAKGDDKKGKFGAFSMSHGGCC